jgi:hypothetical protein
VCDRPSDEFSEFTMAAGRRPVDRQHLRDVLVLGRTRSAARPERLGFLVAPRRHPATAPHKRASATSGALGRRSRRRGRSHPPPGNPPCT